VELVRLWESQKISFQNLVRRQRQAMKHLNKILTDSKALHSQVVAELEAEKAKNLAIRGRFLPRTQCLVLILFSTSFDLIDHSFQTDLVCVMN